MTAQGLCPPPASCPGVLTPRLFIESSSLEEPFPIKPNHQESIITVTPKPCHPVPHPDASWTPPEIVTPPLPTSLPSLLKCLTTRTVFFFLICNLN